MSSRPHSSPRRLLGAVAATGALGVVAMAPASASAAGLSQNLTCTAQVLTSPLAKWGDSALYWLAPDGGFEAGGKGWTLKGSKVVTGNETLGVLKGTKSLQFPTVGVNEATSPEFCVDPLHPMFRFVVKNTSSTAVLNTYINFRSALGTKLTVTAKVNTLKVGSWQLSQSQPLAGEIPSVFLGTGTTASITFKVLSPTGALNIDNLLIDPYRRG